MSANSDSREHKIKKRREERKEAFCLLFEFIFRKDDMAGIIEDAKDARDAEIGSYTMRIVNGVTEHLEEIDGIISKNLKGWRIERISKVALAVLRLAIYEMKYVKEVPVSVSINEAVELTKKYAVPGDASFVNGVLGAAAKQLAADGEQ